MRWMGILNLALCGLIILSSTFFIMGGKEEDALVFIPRPEQKELPKSPFSEAEEFFQEVGGSVFSLVWVPPQMQLPDLRQELIFYGKNLRPDSTAGKESFHLAFKGSDERVVLRSGERAYLIYQGDYSTKVLKKGIHKEKERTPMGSGAIWGEASKPALEKNQRGLYVFSPGNQPTPLWFEARSINDQLLEVRVSMLDEKGALVPAHEDLRCFHCQAQEFPRTQIVGWDLGGHRVDTTLLARQKARWVGSDLFLALHGGDEFGEVIGKERIDFLDGELPYSCFVAAGDFLIWKEGRWKVIDENNETQGLPLLVVKKIDEKLMTFELWDQEGRGKTLLSLIRSREHNGKPNIAQEIKFVGAKTWAQFIVECRNGVRMTLKLHDWLVLTQDGWKKLDSPDQIDAYVNQSLTGPLFILDRMVKQNGKQVLIGHLFNSSRTEVEQVELASSGGTSLANFYRPLPMTAPPPPPIQILPAETHLEGETE